MFVTGPAQAIRYDRGMTLPRFSLISLLFSLILTPPSWADSKADWRDYAWQTIRIPDCQGDSRVVTCPPYHQRWDWKRDQWVDITVTIDGTKLALTQTLTNRAIRDDDHVCVTALVVDASGADIIAHHQNWHMDPRQSRSDSFSYNARRLPDAVAIHIGSKQCREGAHQDDDVLARVEAGIKP